MSKADNKELDFGDSMSRLEQLVSELETGNLSVDVAIKKFEDGAKLASQLQNYLKEAQLKINKIKADLPNTTLQSEKLD